MIVLPVLPGEVSCGEEAGQDLKQEGLGHYQSQLTLLHSPWVSCLYTGRLFISLHPGEFWSTQLPTGKWLIMLLFTFQRVWLDNKLFGHLNYIHFQTRLWAPWIQGWPWLHPCFSSIQGNTWHRAGGSINFCWMNEWANEFPAWKMFLCRAVDSARHPRAGYLKAL